MAVGTSTQGKAGAGVSALRSGWLARVHWELGAMVLAFVASAFVVPTLTPVTISDDWIYQRSVRILVEEWRLDVHPLVSSNLVFQAVWGALFGAAFGVTPGVMRVSSIVLWLLAGAACYGLMFALTARRGLSALGATAFLFNPLGYVLAFTFMTDVPFTSVFVLSTYCSARALMGGRVEVRWLLAGGVLAAAAVLIRQPGLLIPLGTLSALLVLRRLRPDVRGALSVLAVLAPPLVAYAAYYYWLVNVNGVPVTQGIMQEDIFRGGAPAILKHGLRIAGIEVIYAGLFVLPVVAPAFLQFRSFFAGLVARGWFAFSIWQAFVVGAVAGLAGLGMKMFYIPHFMTPSGLGPNDLIFFGRWPVMSNGQLWLLTLLCAFAALCLGILVIRAALTAIERRQVSPVLVFVLVTLVWQAGAVLIVSSHFRLWSVGGVPSPSLDRYVLPLLPLVLCVAGWALRELKVQLALGWYLGVLLAVFSVVGTRDNIVFHKTVWDFAQQSVASGIPELELDAGGSWTGHYFGEYSYATRGIVPNADGRWWLGLYGSAIDPEYVITTTEASHYTTLAQYDYDLWLDTRPARLFLLRREYD